MGGGGRVGGDMFFPQFFRGTHQNLTERCAICIPPLWKILAASLSPENVSDLVSVLSSCIKSPLRNTYTVFAIPKILQHSDTKGNNISDDTLASVNNHK